MPEINVKIAPFDFAIMKLQQIQQSCSSAKTAPPATEGGGKTVQEMEEMGKLYNDMYDHFMELVSSSVLFLQKAKDGFVSSDMKAAAGMKSK